MRYTPTGDDPDALAGATTGRRGVAAPSDARTLGDTFEDAVVLEPGRAPTELCFRIGPASGANATFTRDDAGADPRGRGRVRRVPVARSGQRRRRHADRHDRRRVALARRAAHAVRHDHRRVRTAARRAPRPPARTRRGRSSARCTHDSPRDLARILDATTSPDVAFRRIAIERLEGADAAVGAPTVDPRSRRLVACRAPRHRARARRLRPARTRADLLERALGDSDACVRYYAVRGLVAIGLEPSLPGRAPPPRRHRRAGPARRRSRPRRPSPRLARTRLRASRTTQRVGYGRIASALPVSFGMLTS